MTVYLIHLNTPMRRGTSARGKALTAGHYLGYTDDLVGRLLKHAESRWEPLPEPVLTETGGLKTGTRHGDGCTFLAAANYRGCSWRLARVWDDGDQALERRLKNRKNAPQLCPICHPGANTQGETQ